MKNRERYMQKYRDEYKKKKRRVTITMEPAEFDLFQEKSVLLGKSVPEAIKSMALSYVDEVPMVPVVNERLAKELNLLLRNMGNNMNQIAHNLNLARHLYGPEANSANDSRIKDIQAQLMDLEEEMASIFALYGQQA